MSAANLYVPLDLMRDLGLAPELLSEAALERFQWAAALAIAEGVLALESSERFAALAADLRDLHPAWILGYERAAVAEDVLGAGVHVDEAARYLSQRIAAGAGVEPAWQAAHRERARVVAPPRPGRAAPTPGLRAVLQRSFGALFGHGIAARLVELSAAPPETTAVWRDVFSHPHFRGTRQALGVDTAASPQVRSAADIEGWIVNTLAAALKISPRTIDPTGDLPSLAVDSHLAVALSGDLIEYLGRPVPATLLWDHATIRELSQALATEARP